MESPIDILPDDDIYLICKFLTYPQVVNLSQVNKRFYHLILDFRLLDLKKQEAEEIWNDILKAAKENKDDNEEGLKALRWLLFNDSHTVFRSITEEDYANLY